MLGEKEATGISPSFWFEKFGVTFIKMRETVGGARFNKEEMNNSSLNLSSLRCLETAKIHQIRGWLSESTALPSS